MGSKGECGESQGAAVVGFQMFGRVSLISCQIRKARRRRRSIDNVGRSDDWPFRTQGVHSIPAVLWMNELCMQSPNLSVLPTLCSFTKLQGS